MSHQKLLPSIARSIAALSILGAALGFSQEDALLFARSS